VVRGGEDRPGADAELVVEAPVEVAVDRHGLGLSADPDEHAHEERVGRLVERVTFDEKGQLTGETVEVSGREVDLHPLERDLEALLVKASTSGLHVGTVAHPCEGRTPRERLGLVQQVVPVRAPRAGSRRPSHERLASAEVGPDGVVEAVAGDVGEDQRRGCHLAPHPGDDRLDPVARRGVRAARPDPLGQGLDGDDAVPGDGEAGQEGTFRRGQCNVLATPGEPDRAEDAHAHTGVGVTRRVPTLHPCSESVTHTAR